MAFEFDAETLQRLRDQRRAHRRHNLDATIGQLFGADARQTDTYMTPQQKMQATMQIAEKIDATDRFYYEQAQKAALEKMKNMTDLHKAILGMETEKLRARSESAKMSAQLQTQAYDRELRRIEMEQDRARTLDPATKAIIGSHATTAKNSLDAWATTLTQKVAAAAQTPTAASAYVNERMAEDKAKGKAKDESVYRAELAELQGMLSAPGGFDQVVERNKLRAISSRDVPDNVRKPLESALQAIFSEGVPPEQQKIALDTLGGDLGLRSRDLAKALGMGEVVQKVDAEVARLQQERVARTAEVFDARLRASRATYGSSKDLDAARDNAQAAVLDAMNFGNIRLGRDPLPTGAPDAAPTSEPRPLAIGVDGVPAAAGAGGPGGGAGAPGAGAPEGADPVEAEFGKIAQMNDARQQYVKILETIEAFPEAPPAQHMRQQLMKSAPFQAFKTANGYDGFDDNKVWREFVYAGKKKMKEQDRQFQRLRDFNRERDARRGVGGETVVHGASMRGVDAASPPEATNADRLRG